jgi:hypothetical protein
MDRREFLKRSSVLLAGLALMPIPHIAIYPTTPPPASLGRITTWRRQGVYVKPRLDAERVAWHVHDEIIPLYAAVKGDAPWPSNAIWYETDGGFIHSAFVQPVEDRPQREVVTRVASPGFWAEVSVPIAEARWQANGASVARRLYYGSVYRVVAAEEDETGQWWYRIQEGYSFIPSLYLPAWSLRRFPPGELLPISPDRDDKRIEIRLSTQTLTCFEGKEPVFETRISSGISGLVTPRGEYRVIWKRHTHRMIGGTGEDYYDLPGVAFPTYLTPSGVAIHGTYWHNDFGQPHSHGCVNVTNEAARWIFRWTTPVVPYRDHFLRSNGDDGTPIAVL